MIEKYFYEIEKVFLYFKRIIKTYSIDKKIYNEKQGYLKGEMTLIDENIFHFLEVKNIDQKSKIKYKYHLMSSDNKLLFRYDNAPHHSQLKNYPHHKHVENDQVLDHGEPEIFDVLLEIQEIISRKAK